MWLPIGNTIMRCGSASVPALPTGLTLTLISGGVRVSFTDNSGGTAEHEIWAQSNGGVSALLTTLAAADVSYDDTVSPVDLRYYKVRAKVGSSYSAYTAEVSIAMLGANLVPAASSSFATDGTAWWSIASGTRAWNAGGWMTVSAAGTVPFLHRAGLLTSGKTYQCKLRVKSSVYSANIGFTCGGGSPTPAWVAVTSSWAQISQTAIDDADAHVYISLQGALTGDLDLDDITIQEVLVP